jgi:hypothetical protein
MLLYLRKQKMIMLGIGPGNKEGEVGCPKSRLAE